MAIDAEAARVAHNDDVFRKANEALREKADELDVSERLPFLCECADGDCTEVVLLSRAEYERVRARPSRFLCLPGHEVAAGPHAIVAERGERYLVVEKVGDAGRVAVELDGRHTPG